MPPKLNAQLIFSELVLDIHCQDGIQGVLNELQVEAISFFGAMSQQRFSDGVSTFPSSRITLVEHLTPDVPLFTKKHTFF